MLSFKIFAFILALAILVPNAIKLAHTFNHSTHNICDSDKGSKTHFHKLDLDCNFYKFKLNKEYSFKLKLIDLKPTLFNPKITNSKHELVYGDSKFKILLRGPPIT